MEKTSLNPLKPSLRERSRYILFSIKSEKKFSSGIVFSEIKKALLRFIGELGLSEISYRPIEFNEKTQEGIIKVNHTGVDRARASLVLIKEMEKSPGVPVSFRTIKVSGILKKLRASYSG